MAKITKIEAKNYRSLRFLSMSPTGLVVRILGTNGQGKSNALEALRAVLLGARDGAGDPITHGEKGAEVRVVLGDKIEAVMRWTGRGRSLDVLRIMEDGSTAKVEKPRDLIDKIVGRYHDVGAILRVETPEQERALRDSLLAAAGVDTADLDAAAEDLRGKRAEANAEAKRLAARLAAMPRPAPGTPDAEVSVAALMEQEATVRAAMDARAKAEREREHLHQRAEMGRQEVERCRALLASAESALAAVEADIAAHVIPTAPTASEANALRCKIMEADEVNGRVRQAREWAALNAESKAANEAAREAQEALDAVAAAKVARLAEARLPIPDAAITDDGLTWRGERFHNLSRAQRLVVAVGLGIATRGKLDCLWIDDAEGIDAANEALIERMAEEAGVQVLLASAVKDGPAGLVIEGADAECETTAEAAS